MGQMVKAVKRPEHVIRLKCSAKISPNGRIVKSGSDDGINAITLAVLNSDFERIIDIAAQKAVA